MELPNLGEHCGVSTCKQLDFLPFTCDLCKIVFCKEHMGPMHHDCSQFKDNVLSEKPAISTIISYKCFNKDCSALDQVEMLCEQCSHHYCVQHRFHECHQVDTNRRKQLREQWKIPKEQFKQAKLETDKQIEEKLNKAEIKTENRSLAHKIRLMKLKSKAIGDSRIPTNDRIYFNVHAPKDDNVGCKPIYVSRDWSIGKVIDYFASRLKIINENKNANVGNKLKLFQTNGQIVGKEFSQTLNDFIKNEQIYNGENLILERTAMSELTQLDYDFVV